MAESVQYLRIGLQGTDYLLPSDASSSIEQRENLVVNSEGGTAGAWLQSRRGRWPAYCLDRTLSFSQDSRWQRAVFVDAQPHPVGLLADEIQLLPRQVRIEPFTPLGHPPSGAGHLFNGAWLREGGLTLVFDPKALVAYLLQGAR